MIWNLYKNENVSFKEIQIECDAHNLRYESKHSKPLLV